MSHRPDELTPDDVEQLSARCITVAEARRQLRLLAERPPAVLLDRPCTIGDGIVAIDPGDHASLVASAAHAAAQGRLTKFVPASGAATRMFKDLAAALRVDPPSAHPAGETFFGRFDDFPFERELRARSGLDAAISSPDDERRALRTLLYEMRYAELPKALIAFHREGEAARTPFEEHLLEGAGYTTASDGTARTHFTVAAEFREAFDRVLADLASDVRRRTGATPVVDFSVQHPSTDTLALTADGHAFRTAEGTLLFRPSGHGALIENLNGLGADLVVIKNIDNVVPYSRSTTVVIWKRLLIGYLTRLERELTLDRPLRVCGVVKNEGEPGGAPFFVRDAEGRLSPQIVESSQVDMTDASQRRIFESSTHFNPVDVVCAVRDRQRRAYDLTRFVDPSAAFVTHKSHEGRDLVALERPGLWNGAMAGWHTVFVDVPADTFAPVKTVFDLLRPEHQ